MLVFNSYKMKTIFFLISQNAAICSETSAAMLAGNGSDMQGTHPMMYRLLEYSQNEHK
jgi:hypothetical protein